MNVTWNIHSAGRDVCHRVDVVRHGDGGRQAVSEGNVDLADEVLARVDHVRTNDLALVPVVGGFDDHNLLGGHHHLLTVHVDNWIQN
jgi:hypothetical protein